MRHWHIHSSHLIHIEVMFNRVMAILLWPELWHACQAIDHFWKSGFFHVTVHAMIMTKTNSGGDRGEDH